MADLLGHIVGHALRTAVADNTRRGLTIDVVIDFNSAKTYVGRLQEEQNMPDVAGRRQSTLRFMEAIGQERSDPNLCVDQSDRHRFPADFKWNRVTDARYAFLPVLEAIGLQFADFYVNVWRHLQFGAHPRISVSRAILTRAKQTDYFWAPDGVPPESAGLTQP